MPEGGEGGDLEEGGIDHLHTGQSARLRCDRLQIASGQQGAVHRRDLNALDRRSAQGTGASNGLAVRHGQGRSSRTVAAGFELEDRSCAAGERERDAAGPCVQCRLATVRCRVGSAGV